MLLGTGTPNADPNRSGPAVAIVVNGSSYLVDVRQSLTAIVFDTMRSCLRRSMR